MNLQQAAFLVGLFMNRFGLNFANQLLRRVRRLHDATNQTGGKQNGNDFNYYMINNNNTALNNLASKNITFSQNCIVEAVFEVKHTCRSKLVVVSPELSVCRHRLHQASHQEQPKGPRPATSETKQESAFKQQEVNR